MGLVHVRHMPTFLSVEPASVCQLRCPECPVGQANGGASGHSDIGLKAKGERLMAKEVWERVLREAGPYVHTIQFFFQGEPLLHPRLPDMIRDARAYHIYTIVSTNAQAMTPELAQQLMQAGLNRIIVSIDGLSPESYGAYRVGGSLERSLDALRWLREAKQKTGARCTIEMQCLRLRTNEHEWAEMQRRYRQLGADRLVFKTAQLYDYADGHPLMPTDLRYSRYLPGKDGKYHRRPLRPGCYRTWSGCVITTSGEVLPCCYDKQGAHSYGNIMQTSLCDLYQSESAQRFRRQALRHRHAICQNCWQ